MPGSFADSNILLYLVDTDPAKAKIAEQILRKDVSISVQVLSEMASVMLGRWRRGWEEVESVLALVRGATTIYAIDLDTHVLGMSVAKRYRLGIYDSLIVAAALIAGCDTLYSEDMQNGLLVEGQLRVVNPFA